MSDPRHITLNGERQLVEASTIAGLLLHLDLTPTKIAVERNREIVPKSAYAQTPVDEDDIIEIVQFVGGG